MRSLPRRENPVAVLAVSREGLKVARMIAAGLRFFGGQGQEPLQVRVWAPPSCLPPSADEGAEGVDGKTHAIPGTLKDLVGDLWPSHSAIVGVMATGIMVRSIAPWVSSKHSDPAVVVVDDAGRHVVSLLGGHEGGANRLAERVAEITRGVPVITTGSEARKRTVVGVGSRKGVSAVRVLAAIERAVEASGLTPEDVRALSTIDFKANEPGIREAAAALEVPLFVVSSTRVLALQEALREKNFVESKTGVAGVCVPAAMLGPPNVMPKGQRVAGNGVAVALAVDACGLWESAPEDQSI